MELTFIIEDLALLHFGEPQALASIRRRAHLIENSTRIVKVGIDGSREISVVSLRSHQPESGAKVSPKLNL